MDKKEFEDMIRELSVEEMESVAGGSVDGFWDKLQRMQEDGTADKVMQRLEYLMEKYNTRDLAFIFEKALTEDREFFSKLFD